MVWLNTEWYYWNYNWEPNSSLSMNCIVYMLVYEHKSHIFSDPPIFDWKEDKLQEYRNHCDDFAIAIGYILDVYVSFSHEDLYWIWPLGTMTPIIIIFWIGIAMVRFFSSSIEIGWQLRVCDSLDMVNLYIIIHYIPWPITYKPQLQCIHYNVPINIFWFHWGHYYL